MVTYCLYGNLLFAALTGHRSFLLIIRPFTVKKQLLATNNKDNETISFLFFKKATQINSKDQRQIK